MDNKDVCKYVALQGVQNTIGLHCMPIVRWLFERQRAICFQKLCTFFESSMQ